MNLLQETKVFHGELYVIGNVQITGTDYIPPIPNQQEVESEIANILKIENATERAIEYMLYGMRKQLFWDGNKRTSTICANKIMIENGAGIIKIPDSNLEEFNILLSDFYTTNNNSFIFPYLSLLTFLAGLSILFFLCQTTLDF